jgi:hypothetical protein
MFDRAARAKGEVATPRSITLNPNKTMQDRRHLPAADRDFVRTKAKE